MYHDIWPTSGSVLRSCPPRWCRHLLGGARHLWSLAPRRLAVAVRGSSRWNAALLRFPGQASLASILAFPNISHTCGKLLNVIKALPLASPSRSRAAVVCATRGSLAVPCVPAAIFRLGVFFKWECLQISIRELLSLFLFWSNVWQLKRFAKDCLLTGQVKEPG